MIRTKVCSFSLKNSSATFQIYMRLHCVHLNEKKHMSELYIQFVKIFNLLAYANCTLLDVASKWTCNLDNTWESIYARLFNFHILIIRNAKTKRHNYYMYDNDLTTVCNKHTYGNCHISHQFSSETINSKVVRLIKLHLIILSKTMIILRRVIFKHLITTRRISSIACANTRFLDFGAHCWIATKNAGAIMYHIEGKLYVMLECILLHSMQSTSTADL